jgi:GlcNAc-P-P-Und epimerase
VPDPATNGPDDVAVIFGGAGFIGHHLADGLLKNGFSRVVLADLGPPKLPVPAGAEFIEADVRRPLDPALGGGGPAAIFNLAAVHRTPGHEDREYHETNETGARTVTEFARAVGCRRLFFTSSIAVYGPSEAPTDESSELRPTSAYGRSKLAAERIHCEWAEAGQAHRLVIVRPATIFGPGEGGNFTRLADALRRRRFMYPGRRDTRKACGYVTDLVRSMLFMERFGDPVVTYNFAYPGPPTIEEVCDAFCRASGYPRPLGTVPLPVMLTAARVLHTIGKDSFDPARVMKLVESTNIIATRLVDAGFEYETDLQGAVQRWRDTDPPGAYV